MSHPSQQPNILLLDIETAPNDAYVWGLFDQNISIDQIIASGYTLCVSWKWLGQKKVHYLRIAGKEKGSLQKLHKVLDKADMVVHYNGTKFDIPTLNKEFLLHSVAPPSPVKQIDLLKFVRRHFKFSSNKLDYVCQQLGLGNKLHHKGMALWKGCVNNNRADWKVMREYNMEDVRLLERLYYRIRPWIRHPNYTLYTGEPNACPRCGSTHYHSRGTYRSASVSYKRYQCTSCNGWFHGEREAGHKPIKHKVIT